MGATPAMPGKEGENGGQCELSDRPHSGAHPRYSLGSLEIKPGRSALPAAEDASVRSGNPGLSEDPVVQNRLVKEVSRRA